LMPREGLRNGIRERAQTVKVKVSLLLGEGFRGGIGEFPQAREVKVSLMLGENFGGIIIYGYTF